MKDFLGKELSIGDTVIMIRPVYVNKRKTLLATGKIVAMNCAKDKVKLSYIDYADDYLKKRGIGDEEKETWQMSNYVVSMEPYNELIMAVERKFPNETRHETALRYIKEVEEAAKTPSHDCWGRGEFDGSSGKWSKN